MPTIFRSGGFRFVIWPDDHPPPHVHIVRGTRLAAIVNLGIKDKPASIKENFGLNRQEMARVFRVVAANNGLFAKEWKKIHGDSES